MTARHATTILGAAVLAALMLAGALVVGASANAATARSCAGGSVRLDSDEKRMLKLYNGARKSRGLRPLCVHPALQRAARAHSKKILKKDRLLHWAVGPRLERYGYRWSTYGENIGGGAGRRGSPEHVFERWMQSRPHAGNILKKRFREVGIGTATGTFKGTRGYTVYTADFGARRR